MQPKHSDDTTLGRLYPRLQYAALPDAILALEHVLTYIDELLMTPEEATIHAAICAARGAQVERLQNILWRICFYDRERIADNLLEVAAEYGHCNVIKVVYDCWERHFLCPMYRPGWKALEVAIRHGHLNAVTSLLPRFSWNLKEWLKVALETQQQDMLELLCQSASDNEILWAAVEGHLQVIRLIHGRMPGEIVYRALTVAASGGHLHIIEFLFDVYGWHRFEAYHLYIYGPAIELAAQHGHGEVVQFLVTNQAFTSRTELDDAFKAAAAHGHSDILEFLYGQAVRQHSLLNEAYLLAAGGGALKTMKVLFRMGANSPQLVAEALVRATEWQRSDVVEFLLLHGADGAVLDEAFLKAAVTWDVKTVKFLHRIKWKSRDSLFTDAFVKAARAGSVEVVAFLINGVTQEEVLNTAFLQAADAEKWATVEVLECNAEIKKTVVDDVFMRAVEDGRCEMVRYMCNKWGNKWVSQTALLERGFLVAAERGHRRILEFLYSHGVRSPAVLARASKKAARHCHFKIVGILSQWGPQKRCVRKKRKH